MISKRIYTVFCALTVLMAAVSCEHKPLYPKEPGATGLAVMFDWSQLEAEDLNSRPESMDLYFYSEDLSSYEKFTVFNYDEPLYIDLNQPAARVNFINADIPVEKVELANGLTILSPDTESGVGAVYGGAFDISDEKELILVPVCLARHIDVSVENASELDSYPNGVKLMLTGLSDRETITGAVPSDALDSHIIVNPVSDGHGNYSGSARFLRLLDQTDSVHHFLYVIASRKSGNDCYLYDMEEQIRLQAGEHTIKIRVDLGQMEILTPDNPYYPDNLTQTGILPDVDEYDDEVITIEL